MGYDGPSCLERGSRELGRKKLTCAMWLNEDRSEKARERLVAMEIPAFEGKRDDNHAMTPRLKVARTLVSREATGLKARRRVLAIHDIRVAFFHAQMEEEKYVGMPRGVCKLWYVALLRRALCGTWQVSWLWQNAIDRWEMCFCWFFSGPMSRNTNPAFPKPSNKCFCLLGSYYKEVPFLRRSTFFAGQDARCTEWPSLSSSKNMFFAFAGRDEEGPARKSGRNRFVHCCVFSSSNFFLNFASRNWLVGHKKN